MNPVLRLKELASNTILSIYANENEMAVRGRSLTLSLYFLFMLRQPHIRSIIHILYPRLTSEVIGQSCISNTTSLVKPVCGYHPTVSLVADRVFLMAIERTFPL